MSLTVEALETQLRNLWMLDPDDAAKALLPFIERHIAAGQQGEQSDLLDDLARIYATIPVLPVTAETAEEATNALLAFCYLPAVRKALDLQILSPAPLGDAEDYLRPLRNAIGTADAYATGGPRSLRIVTLRMDEAEAMLARASLATPQPPKPAGDEPSPDSPIMKWAKFAIAERDAKPAGAIDLAELRKIGSDANTAALTLGEIGLRGACIDTATRIRALLANQPVKPAVADPLSDNPQPLPDNPSLSDKGAVPLPEAWEAWDVAGDFQVCRLDEVTAYGDARAEHAALTMAADILEKCPRCIDAREAAALIQSSCCNICNKCVDGAGRADAVAARLDIAITFDDGEEATIVAHGSDRDMRRLQARIEYWRGLVSIHAPAPQQMTTQGEAVARNPLQAYADSYRMMARMGDGKVDCLSVAIDIENNMSKHTGPQS